MNCPKCRRTLRAAIATVPTEGDQTGVVHFQVTVGHVCPFCKVIVWEDKPLDYLVVKKREQQQQL